MSHAPEGLSLEDDIKQDQIFIDESMRILHEAEKQDVTLRVMGSIAIRLHCPDSINLINKLGRPITDIDYVGYDKQSSKIQKLFENLGYVQRQLSYSYTQAGRLIFINPANQEVVDVFLNRLSMCHTIDYSKRLEVDSPTVPLAEIILQKMQIVMISEKDVKDTFVLFREHEVGNNDNNMINAEYIAKLMSKDWGFYFTVTTNLQKMKNLMSEFSVLNEQDRTIISNRIDSLLRRIEDEPKSSSWKMRAKVGPRKKWYKDVYSAPK